MPDRERFLHEAAYEINEAVQEFRRVLCGLIEKAWEEGKRSAETEAVTAIVESAMKDACERLKAQEASGDA